MDALTLRPRVDPAFRADVLAGLSAPISFTEGNRYRLRADQVNFPRVFELIEVGERILADSANLVLEVVAASSSELEVMALSNGTLWPNRGVHIEGASQRLPFLTERDRALINCGMQAGVEYLSLSYVRNRADIRQVRSAPVTPNQIEIVIEFEALSRALTESAWRMLICDEHVDWSTIAGRLRAATTMCERQVVIESRAVETDAAGSRPD